MKNTFRSSTPLSRRHFLSAGTGVALGAWLMPAALAANRYGIQGQRAPELEVDYWIDHNGNLTEFSLSQAQGQWVFLKCFQYWCPGCHSHGFPTLKKIADAFADSPSVSVAGIQTTFEGFSTNTQDKVRELQLRYELEIPMGHDAGNADGDHQPSTMRNYNTGGTPWMILIDPERRVVFDGFSINAERLIEVLTKQTT